MLELIAAAAFAACALRVALIARPFPGTKLPDPAKVPGMPMAASASIGVAHAALSRKGNGARPKFRT